MSLLLCVSAARGTYLASLLLCVSVSRSTCLVSLLLLCGFVSDIIIQVNQNFKYYGLF